MYYNTKGFSCHELRGSSRKPRAFIIRISTLRDGPVVCNSKTNTFGLNGLLFVLTHLFLRDLDLLAPSNFNGSSLPPTTTSTFRIQARQLALCPYLSHKPICGPSSRWKTIRYILFNQISTNIPFLASKCTVS
jgi:hypothetical protein